MRVTANVIFVLAAVLLLGADGPGGAKTPRADQPKDTARPPMTREGAIRRLKAAGLAVHPAPDGLKSRRLALPPRHGTFWRCCRPFRTRRSLNSGCATFRATPISPTSRGSGTSGP